MEEKLKEPWKRNTGYFKCKCGKNARTLECKFCRAKRLKPEPKPRKGRRWGFWVMKGGKRVEKNILDDITDVIGLDLPTASSIGECSGGAE